MKLLRENVSSNLNLGLSDDFMNLTLKVNATKAKLNKWNYIKLISLCSKGNHQQNEKATY